MPANTVNCSVNADTDSHLEAAPKPMDVGLMCSRDFFYNKYADATVRLKDGDIKFNKFALVACAKSNILYEVFFGQLSDGEVTDMPDLDSDTFKMFLDFIMGYEPINVDNALIVFPVVWKYQIQFFIEKCIETVNSQLQKKAITPKIIEFLNTAVYLGCDELKDKIIYTIFKEYNPYKFLENEEFCSFLEPESMKIILSKMSMDSYLLKIVADWVAKKEEDEDYMLNNLPEKYDFLKDIFQLKYYETTGAMSEFCLLFKAKNLFSADEILTHLQNCRSLIHGKSEWKKMTENSSIEEEIILPAFGRKVQRNYTASSKIGINKVILYDDFSENETIITCQTWLIGKSVSGEIHFQTKEVTVNFKRWDTFYYTLMSCKQDPNADCKFDRGVIKMKWTFLKNCRILLINRQTDNLNPGKTFFSKDCSAVF